MQAALRLARGLGALCGCVPGWYMLVVEPFARRGTDLVQVSSSGTRYELDLSEFVQRKFYFRSYERRELRFLRSTLSAGDLFVDVGANVGLLSLCASRHIGEHGGVLAIEPVPENLERLQVNASLNPGRPIDVLPVAIGVTSGTIRLGLPESQAAIGNSGARSSASSENQIEVDVISLNDAIERWRPGAGAVRLIKLDVEGMENEVLRGGQEVFGTRTQCVMLEVNHRYGHDDGAIDSLRRLGYEIYRLGAFARLRPWKDSRAPRTRAATLGRILPAGIGEWLTGESRLSTAIAIWG